MIKTKRFGEIEVPPSQVIHLPLGLLRIPDEREREDRSIVNTRIGAS